MTRRGSRTEGRTPTDDRPAADYTTGAPHKDAPVLRCACGAIYRDYPDSYAAHRTAHGHRPIQRPTAQQE